MNTVFKRHLTIEFSNCIFFEDISPKTINLYLRESCKELSLGKIDTSFFLSNPDGITLVVILDNSLINFSLNPCTGIALMNIDTNCNSLDILSGANYIKTFLNSDKYTINEISVDTSRFNLRTSTLTKKNTSMDLSLTIIGSCGGVAKSLLSILNKSSSDSLDPIHNNLSCCKLNLVDVKQKPLSYYEENFPSIYDKITLYEFDANNINRFIEHLKETQSNYVIDVSFADTVSTLRCCDMLNVTYINSAFESLSVDKDPSLQGFPLQERYKVFESHRNEFKNTTAIICSGMNPGIVQWLAIDLMKREPTKLPTGCYIVENDTSFYEDSSLADKNTLYTTWSTECFLDEAIYSYPAFMKNHNSLFIYDDIYGLEFKVSLGKDVFTGCLMPHEEAITLGKLYNMETGFIYKINDHTTNLIKDNISNLDALWEYPMKVLDPVDGALVGSDLVGILLTYDNTELFAYNKLNNKDIFAKYKTNATYHQVACGLYAALSSLLLDNIPRGIYYVDELLTSTPNNYGKYAKYHIGEITIGKNNFSDGTLLERLIPK